MVFHYCCKLLGLLQEAGRLLFTVFSTFYEASEEACDAKVMILHYFQVAGTLRGGWKTERSYLFKLMKNFRSEKIHQRLPGIKSAGSKF